MSAGANPQATSESQHDMRQRVGLVLLSIGIAAGSVLFVAQFLLLPLLGNQPGVQFKAMAIGAVMAIPASLIHLAVPRLLDRYDPEPGYALLGCYMWGALAATAFSAPINTCVSMIGSLFGADNAGVLIETVVSAPFVEELWKGLGVAGMFYFVRREFDGVVDGIIYASFIALGFAMVENIEYYARADLESTNALALTVMMRGVLTPWAHPLFTAMTGVGFGLARESLSPVVRRIAPFVGYACAVGLHSLWNAGAMLAHFFGVPLFSLLLFMWGVLMVAFMTTLVLLVHRRGRILREQLEEEVMIGTITQAELDVVVSAFGRLHARLLRGERGEDFARAVARLGLSKWHALRAMKTNAYTYSREAIVPLRVEIAEIRRQMLLANAPVSHA